VAPRRPDRARLGEAPSKLGFAYRAIDFSEENQSFLRRKREVAARLGEDYAVEGRPRLR
jgi:hypothetical protein